MNRWWTIVVFIAAVAMVSCGGNDQSKSKNIQSQTLERGDSSESVVSLSEREKLLYDKTSAKVAELEVALTSAETGDVENVAKLLSDIRKLQYHYNDTSMNSVTRDYCAALAERIAELKERAKKIGGESSATYTPVGFGEMVKCGKNDAGATAVETIKMVNIFAEPRKFTLRGQLKASLSGAARAVVAVPVPAGATEILYSLRISTSEQKRSSDGEFYNKLGHSYRRIDVFNIPVYKSTRRSGLIDMILDDNRPISEEDAYCNMYVFRKDGDAKKFQDGGVAISNLGYDVTYSTLGTQSCNGSIPVNGSKTIYLAFENERMRYANYLWVEAVAVTPTTEYYTTKHHSSQ